MAHTFPTREQAYRFEASVNVFYMKISHLPQGSRSSSSFLEFCKNYRSKFDKCMESYSRVGRYPIDDVLLRRPAKSCPTHHYDRVLQRYENFDRYAIVDDYSDHLFATEPFVESSKNWGATKTSKLWLAAISKDRESFENGFPETIYVRAYSSRMDLLRVLIVGPKGTPYQDGLFFFDMYFSETYPWDGPLVRVHCASYAIHPHMMKCGQFHLCICRKPVFRKQVLWVPLRTTLHGFLIKLNDFILNAEPLFHEPGFQGCAPWSQITFLCYTTRTS
ncbi:putative ubiquitin-conjugating enzyme E2 39 [Bidens hawaiensis]|uniref:putative ubiquitin-conjugating enzyme E2 39 n=1 Tax=Bidens hawaiensis TaxID=980011 RepID=UPI00404B851B